MATLCKTYPTQEAAREAVDALRATGVPACDIRLLIGGTEHDIRREPVGGFAGPVEPRARVGNYGGATRRRRQSRGVWAGDPDHRQGSFADTDSDVIATADGHASATDDGQVKALLGGAMPPDIAERVLGELHHGRAVVIAELPKGRMVEEH
jgi:hypothetical protein